MEIPNEEKFIVAADIGGSHITAAVVDLSNKLVRGATCIRRYVDAHESAEQILAAWANVIQTVLNQFPLPINRVALAVPGPFDYENGISLIKGLHKYESLFGVDVKTQLANLLNLKAENIKFRNDAEAFIHGEVIAGAGQNAGKVIGFTLGTGMGSAISDAGVTTDANWGSEPFGSSIADDYFSTRWFLKAYTLLSSVHCNNVKELAELAQVDGHALNVFNSFAKSFAHFITDKIITERPDLVLIGGNIAKAKHLFFETLQLQLTPYIDPLCIVADQLGENAALIGAAFTFELNLNTSN